MRLSEPRVEPLPKAEWDEDATEILRRVQQGERILNIHQTLARHPKLLKRWVVFGNHVLYKSTLPARDREILILRVGWVCRCEYEWAQHAVIGRSCGLTDEEIRRITEGPDAPGWTPADATLLRAADDLIGDAFISDATWEGETIAARVWGVAANT
jgi:alkylhydroperoxidase family enzyme